MGLTGEDKEIGDGGGFQAGVDDAPPPENQENSAAGARVIRYRECLRNHAVSIGGSVTDGCGEFMPAGEEGTVASLKCAACNCHRNFHRQETPHGGAPLPPNPPALPSFASMTHRHNAWASLAALSPKTFGGAAPPTTAAATAAPATVASSFQEPNFNPHKCFSSAPFPFPAAATTAAVANSFQEPNFNPHKCFTSTPFPSPATAAAATAVPAPAAVDTSFQESIFNPHKCFTSAPFPSPSTTAAATAPVPSPPSAAETRGKKRFRTKFTADQKEKMTEFADKIGWRIPREEENINGVERFCGEIGVKRQIFKVWMHNNKSSAKPNATSPSQSSSSSINN